VDHVPAYAEIGRRAQRGPPYRGIGSLETYCVTKIGITQVDDPDLLPVRELFTGLS